MTPKSSRDLYSRHLKTFVRESSLALSLYAHLISSQGDRFKLVEGEMVKIDYISQEVDEDYYDRMIDFAGESGLCHVVNHYLVFISSLVKDAFKCDKRLLHSFDKTYKIKELINFSSIDEMVNSFIDDTIYDLSYKGFAQLDDFLKNKMNLGLFPDRNILLELIEKRNLITHNRGKIDERFIEKVQHISIANYTVGEHIKIDFEILYSALDRLIWSAATADGIISSRFDIELEMYDWLKERDWLFMQGYRSGLRRNVEDNK